ncbi:MAG: translational GTPase TypA [Clostridia bacterium]|jgi:GTP-binding protein|nr:translational GTPase TypA [Clostridia bacterium]NLV32962.1 translational GTPase TypA [Clostridiaceae bacterium]OQB54226.1 MAG: GTP-binding protein TypA/BipA [Firmicutes bacterium ADurb.Bin146]HQM96995.1 translational GTPase TypA [Clostridia bacterium]HQO70158.1 translational GTPase TypA [Clostridia bacterium]
MIREDLRNIAIIAHVDHGKTTLVDAMLKQSGVFRKNQIVAERIMDSNDLEREKGITILAKNASVRYKNTKINIIDTPGHADFSGEVERVLKMVDGVLLLVDAFEGPMPQTRFVLSKALELNHKVIIVVNKVDREGADIEKTENDVLELLMELQANDTQLDSPYVFCSAKEGIASLNSGLKGTDLSPLFDTILKHINPPKGDDDKPLQVLISSIDYNDYVGRIAIGRIERGRIKANSDVAVVNFHNPKEPYKAKVTNMYGFEGVKREPIEDAYVGDIISFSGIPDISIGDTICDSEFIEAIEFAKISLPTIEMTFSVNDSPFAGREGKFVTSRHLRERLFRETLKDVSLKVKETELAEAFIVMGRGEMHLSILVETMKREGYEFQLSTPRVLYRVIEGVRQEPIEHVYIDVPSDCVGSVCEKMGRRKGEMICMNLSGIRMKMEFLVPARGLFGYRNEFLTDTAGEGIMNTLYEGYAPYKGEIEYRSNGSLIAFETGTAVTYGLYNAQERGVLFINPGEEVYAGMVVGETPKDEDITVNICKKKHVTNMRASGSDEALRLSPPKKMSLEQAMEYIKDDELLEITPVSMRIRKKILDPVIRMRSRLKDKQ